jgi:hypothetical protein
MSKSGAKDVTEFFKLGAAHEVGRQCDHRRQRKYLLPQRARIVSALMIYVLMRALVYSKNCSCLSNRGSSMKKKVSAARSRTGSFSLASSSRET